VEVEDTGAGISAEEQALLFRPFVQTNEGRRINTGTGLGLVISRELARLMGGDVTVVSQLGRGSTFRIEIQIECPESRDEEVIVLHPKEVSQLVDANKPCRILVVDDATDNRRLLVNLLGNIGFEVKEAKDGADAVDRFLDWSPHAILMDLRMPVMDGSQAIVRIRSLPRGREVKIIALTASTFEEDRRAMMQIGADDFLGKPFVNANLLEKLRVLLSLSYVYSEEPKAVAASPIAVANRPALPQEERAALRKSAESGNLTQLLVLITSIETRHPDFGRELRALAENFQYDRLLALAGSERSEK
jgi:CheY-like chemotaxis protein